MNTSSLAAVCGLKTRRRSFRRERHDLETPPREMMNERGARISSTRSSRFCCFLFLPISLRLRVAGSTACVLLRDAREGLLKPPATSLSSPQTTRYAVGRLHLHLHPPSIPQSLQRAQPLQFWQCQSRLIGCGRPDEAAHSPV